MYNVKCGELVYHANWICMQKIAPWVILCKKWNKLIYLLELKITYQITDKKIKTFNHSFLNIIRKIAYPQQPNPTNQMISFLNLRRKQQEASIHCMPSI